MRTSLAVLILVVLAGVGRAEPPDRVFAGTIVASAKAYPPAAKTDAETVAAIRKQSATTFQEDKKDHTWTLFIVGYFKQPLDEMEYVLKVHDLQNKTQVVMTSDKYLSARGMKSASTKLVLDREKIGVNKDLLITMEAKGKVLATTRLRIAGEWDKATGKVDFSEDEDDQAAKPEPPKNAK